MSKNISFFPEDFEESNVFFRNKNNKSKDKFVLNVSNVINKSLEDKLSIEVSERSKSDSILNSEIKNMGYIFNNSISGILSDNMLLHEQINDINDKVRDNNFKVGDSLIDLNNNISALSNRVSYLKNSIKLLKTDDFEYNLTIDDTTIGSISFPKDVILKDVKYYDGKLSLYFNDSNENVVDIDITKIFDSIYKGDNGINVIGDKISLFIDPSSECDFLQVSSNGVKISGIVDKINYIVDNKINTISDSLSDMDKKLNLKIDSISEKSEKMIRSSINSSSLIDDINKNSSSIEELKNKIIFNESKFNDIDNKINELNSDNDLLLSNININDDDINIGTSSSTITINTIKDERIKVVDSSGSHDISYLSDFDVKLNDYITKEELENKKYALSNDLDNFVLKQSLTNVILSFNKKEELYLNEINRLNNSLKDLLNRVKLIEGRIYHSYQIKEVINNSKLTNDSIELTLFNDVVYSDNSAIIIPDNTTVNLNLNGFKIHSTSNDIMFVVGSNSMLNIFGGEYIGYHPMATSKKNGIINVLDGSYVSNYTCFQTNGGVLNITGGVFKADNNNKSIMSKNTIKRVDSKRFKGNIIISGGKFINFDPSNCVNEYPKISFVKNGYKVVEEKEENYIIYKVIPK